MPDQGVSIDNSTNTPLGAGGVFVGASFEDLQFLPIVTVLAYADQPGTLLLEWSNDGVTTHYTQTRIVSAGLPGMLYESQRLAQFFRVTYTNGGTPQGVFSLQTIYDNQGASSRDTSADAPLPVAGTLVGGNDIVSASDNITFNGDFVEVTTNGAAYLAVTFTGTFTAGRIDFEGSNDGFATADSICGNSQGLLQTDDFNLPFGIFYSGLTYVFAVLGYAKIRFTGRGGFAGNTLVSSRLSHYTQSVTINGIADSATRYWNGSIWVKWNKDVNQGFGSEIANWWGTYTHIQNDAPAGALVATPANPTTYLDGIVNPNIFFINTAGAILTGTLGAAWNGAATALLRNPHVFKTVQAAAAGNTALWTPAAGTKFRLMRYMVAVTGDASFAVAGVLTVTLNDAGGAIGQGHDIYIPVAAGIVPGTDYISPWIDLGNGILSAAVNNVLNVNLSAALATGNVRVICCGTEE